MEKAVEKVLRGFTTAMDLPPDVLLDMPRVHMVGNLEVVVDNHKGLRQYTSLEIRVRIKGGVLIVCGKKLRIAFLTKDDLKITGRIGNVEFFAE